MATPVALGGLKALGRADKNVLSLFTESSRRAEPLGLPRPAFLANGPRLALAWEPRGRNFAESAWALLRGPAAPKKFLGGHYFRDCWVSGRAPRSAVLASALWHIAFLLLLFPLLQYVVARPQVSLPQVEITWYGPARDLPTLLPVAESKTRPVGEREKSQPDEVTDQATDKGTEAFHPRQTILNRPIRPNHPRQTLIQPAAPPEPPKILPLLPNIVAWNTPRGPQLPMDSAATRPNPRTATTREEIAAPELPDGNKQLDGLNLAASPTEVQKPTLLVNPLSAPHAKSAQVASQAAPELGGSSLDSSGQSLIALSATPAPVAPPAELLGNLSSTLSISPEVAKGGASGSSGAGGAISGGGSGPPGLSITGGGSDRSQLSSAGRGGISTAPVQSGTAAVGAASPGRIQPGSAPKSTSVTPRGSPSAPGAFIARIKPGTPPESFFDARRVYTLHVNMPNLTSASGSWVLNFAEMATSEEQKKEHIAPGELQVPEPLHKVDPKYPPELRKKRVEGEVVLYAVVRADGTVDSIQLIDGVDPALDLNAMQALAQWKFLPAQRGGVPVELETIVHIPWRASVPFY